LQLFFSNKLSSHQTSYTLVDLADPFSLIPSLFHAEHGPPTQVIPDLAHVAIVARMGYFMSRMRLFIARMGLFIPRMGLFIPRMGLFIPRMGLFVPRMGLFVRPLALLDQPFNPVEP